jgi:putative ABC transport system substrate-binding protein
MKRREFIRLFGGAAISWPLTARAQQPARLRRIGVLMALDESEPEGKAQLLGFTQGLSELGWTVGTNLQMEIRWGAGDVNRIRIFAKELVAMRPDVILSQGTPVTAALRQETQTIPIVFVTVTDPVGEGFVAGLPSPGGNTTGFITSEAAMGSKLLELLMDIAPGIKRVAMIFNPDTVPAAGCITSANLTLLPERQSGAHRCPRMERCRDRIGRNLARKGVRKRPHCYAGLFYLNHSRPIISLAAQNNVPVIYPWRFVVTRDGGLISYGPDFRDIVRRAAPYVDRILRGANPGELPVQVPTKFEMAVNVKAAKALGLKVPTSILIAADEVIE